MSAKKKWASAKAILHNATVSQNERVAVLVFCRGNGSLDPPHGLVLVLQLHRDIDDCKALQIWRLQLSQPPDYIAQLPGKAYSPLLHYCGVVLSTLNLRQIFLAACYKHGKLNHPPCMGFFSRVFIEAKRVVSTFLHGSTTATLKMLGRKNCGAGEDLV